MDNKAFVKETEPGNEPKNTAKEDKGGLQLERRLTYLSGTAIIVGTVIGSGIFITPTDVLERAGSVGMALIAWLVGGIIILLCGLVYAELGTVIPKSGGEYIYFLECFGPLHPFWGPVPAFLYSWVKILLLKPAALAIITISFSKYSLFAVAQAVNADTDSPEIKTAMRLVALLCIGWIMFINCTSVELSARVQTVLTICKLVAIAMMAIGGIVTVFRGDTEYFHHSFSTSGTSFTEFAAALCSVLFAYEAWNSLNYATEELQDPCRNLPKCIFTACPLLIVSYLLVNVAYFSVMSPEAILSSFAVAIDWGNIVLGKASFLVPVAVALSTLGGANGVAFTAGRLCFTSAREGHFLEAFSYVHIEKVTPAPALLFSGIIASLLVLPGDVSSLVDLFSFTSWMFFGLAMVVCIVLRKTKPDAPRPFKVFLPIPYFVILISVYLVIAPIIARPNLGYLFAVLFILLGFVMYVIFVYYGKRFKCIDTFTKNLQLAMLVVPSKPSKVDCSKKN